MRQECARGLDLLPQFMRAGSKRLIAVLCTELQQWSVLLKA